MKHLVPMMALVALSGTSACLHTDSKLPGVLDLRSDGSSAAAPAEPLKPTGDAKREGFGAFINGEGVTATGDKVLIEDRNWHLFGLIHIVNDHGELEYKALGEGNALKGVHVGDSLSGTDAVMVIVPSLVAWIPVVGLIGLVNLAPHMTLQLSGTRIAGSGAAGAVEPPPPTADPTAIDPTAPAPLAPGT